MCSPRNGINKFSLSGTEVIKVLCDSPPSLHFKLLLFSFSYIVPPFNITKILSYAHTFDERKFLCSFLASFTVPKVEIVDERGVKTSDKFYKSGSTIELKCVISRVPQPTSYVTWKHGLRMLNYDTSRGGIR